MAAGRRARRTIGNVDAAGRASPAGPPPARSGLAAFFALATRTGRLDVAVVLSSLYPLATILLARALLREELSRRQQMGAGATIVAIVLIAV